MKACHCTLAGTAACRSCPNNSNFEKPFMITTTSKSGLPFLNTEAMDKAVNGIKRHLLQELEKWYKKNKHKDDWGVDVVYRLDDWIKSKKESLK